MVIYNPNGTTLLDIEVDDNSAAYAEVMNRDDVTLEFSLAEYTDIPLGAYITFEGKRYQMLVPASVTVVNRRNYAYTVTFETDQGKLRIWRIHNMVDGRVVFSLTARPSEHLAMFVANLNEREGSDLWAVAPGSYDEKEITLSYNKTTILDGISQLADECETEWEVFKEGNKVYLSLGKVEYNEAFPLALSYGEDGGFESGVKRTNTGGGLPVQFVYVQGGDRNIDPSTYYNRSHYLLLPRNYSFSFDGEYFNGETGYDSSRAVAMVTDANGYYVKLASAVRGAAEESLDLSDIYPKRVGTVWGVETEQSSTDVPFYNIIDESLGTASGKLNLNYNNYLIEGSQFTIVFQSGMLTGREIGVHKFTLEANRGVFELCQEQIDGFIMPGEGGYVPAVGNTYAVFGCALPAQYIANSATHSGAEFDMLRKAARYVYENKDAKQTFKGTLSKVYARKNWQTIGPKMILGQYVSFTDESVQSSPVLMRILAIKRYINNPYKPEIELSNEATKGTVGSSIQQLSNNFAHTDRRFKESYEYTNRRWRDAKESQDALAEALLEEFSEGISPVTIQTMSALVGSENLQFEIFTNTSYNQYVTPPSFNNAGQLVCRAGYVKHYTLGFTDADYVKSERPNTEYFRWQIAAKTFSFTDEGPYYLYVKATKPASKATVGTAEYMLSKTGIPFEPTAAGSNYDTSHYYMLLAIVSSEVEGSRSIATYNGFTEITPGQIRAMKWISNDGQQFIDFINKSFRIGDASKFLGYNIGADGNYDGQGRLRLKGTIIQSPSGDTFPPPCNRGAYSASTTYYYGDLVTYDGQSWLYINQTSSTGRTPAEGSYWMLYAAKGTNGGVNEARFQWGSNPSSPPTYQPNEQNPGNDWKTAPPGRPQNGTYYLWSISAMRDASGTYGTWGNPIRMTGDTGTAGEDAKEREWIYKLATSNPGTPTNPTDRTIDDYVPSGWSDNPSGVTNSSKTEWASYRDFNHTTDKWGDFSAPIIWSHYGERGMDGDGVEYVYARTTTETPPTITNDTYNNTESNYNQDEFLPHVTGATTTSATDDPQGVSADYPYEWVAKRTKAAADANGVRKWEKYSGAMALWAKFATDGTDGTKGKVMRGRSAWSASGYGGSGRYQGRDTESDDNNQFIDIVLYTNPSTGEALTYLCKLSHTASASITPLNTTYWEEMNQFSMIATSALYAEHAHFEQASANQFDSTDGGNAGTNITGNNVSVTNSLGTEFVSITPESVSAGGSSGTESFSITSKSGSGSVVTLSLCSFTVSSSSNKVSIPALAFNFSIPNATDTNTCAVNLYIDDTIPFKLGNISYGTTAAVVNTTAGAVSLNSGNHTLKAFCSIENPQGDAVSGSVTSGTGTITVKNMSSSSATKLGGDGFSSIWGSEGIKITSSGAKVIHGNIELMMIGGAALNGLTAPVKFVLCTAYPDTLEANAFYFKVSQS